MVVYVSKAEVFNRQMAQLREGFVNVGLPRFLRR